MIKDRFRVFGPLAKKFQIWFPVLSICFVLGAVSQTARSQTNMTAGASNVSQKVMPETPPSRVSDAEAVWPGSASNKTECDPDVTTKLRERVEELERRLSELERRGLVSKEQHSPLDTEAASVSAREAIVRPSQTGAQTSPPSPSSNGARPDPFDGFRYEFLIDGYYSFNANRPEGRVNLLRAYDVLANSFSLNQAGVILERAPDPERGRRVGLRLDLMFGQATETLQGNSNNELRPQVYRHIWQAYGTYVLPVGKGLKVDFGKWASSLGYESNYTKDNFNYSRSFYFNFLPFYHFGVRTNYALSDRLTFEHWLVNGTQQSEDFNGFKSRAFLINYKPSQRITSQFNYYFGQEQRDLQAPANGSSLPVQPGLGLNSIRPSPDGRLHIFDTYHTFSLTKKLTIALEADYVVGRVRRSSPPATVWGGAGYVRYQFNPKIAMAGRFEYLAERTASDGALFSGVTQALKEHTLTFDYLLADGFLGRIEYRRDFSNRPFFLTEKEGVLKKEQNTLTLGLTWWFNSKRDR